MKKLLLVLLYMVSAVHCARLSKRDWLRRHNLTCKFCEKKKNIFGLVPELEHNHEEVIISFEAELPKCRLDDRFLSFSLDALELKRNLRCFPLESRKINTLARALSPAYFRVGGTPQDFLIFTEKKKIHAVENDQGPSSCHPMFENWTRMKQFQYTHSEFEELFTFTQRNNFRLIFGLNALTRDRKGSWVISNATKAVLNKYSGKVDWEIGNEPNRFSKYGGKTKVSARQLARDDKKLRGLLKNSKSKIYGPDISKPSLKPLKYLKKYLAASPPIDAVTYHMYEMHQTEASVEAFLNPIYMSKLKEQMSWIDQIVQNSSRGNLSRQKDVWVGETGSASGGGAPGFSDRFISGFHHLSKIGLASEFCHKVFIRQSFYGGHYGMLDPITHNPLPDYWVTLLFKQLIKNVVLSSSANQNSFFRTHFYCSKMVAGDVVVSFVNMKQRSNFFLSVKNYEKYPIEKYIFTNPEGLTSKNSYLNGELLRMISGERLPQMKGVDGVRQPVEIPRLSYGFLVFKNTNVKACM
eukprot:TCONS_00062070-protein